RILIDSDRQTTRTCFAHEAECHRRLSPKSLVADLEMRNFNREPGLFANLDTLTNRVGDFLAFVSHVRRVDAAEPAGNAGQRDDFVSLRVSSGNVDQSG